MSKTFWISDKHLDDTQASAVKDMPESASFLIRGPAGSGKTNILLLRAKWFLIKNLSELRIIVFTSSLKNFVQLGCRQYEMPSENVVTSHHFFIDLLRQYGIEVTLSGSFEADRAMLAGTAQSLVESKKLSNLYDALLVDECQDYMDTELLVLRRLTKRLILVADSRQSIYRTTHTPELLEELVQNNVVDLKYHYRCGLKLCIVADAILRDSANFLPLRGECRYSEDDRPSSVALIKCVDLNFQFATILGRLQGQLDLYPEEYVGVLFPKREQQAAFEKALSSAAISDKSRVVIDTMHGAKGLEFRAVHLAGCEALYKMGPTQKRLAYTSVLRGKTAAAIYYSGSVPGYLQSAVAKLEPPKPDPSLAALFES